MINVHSRTVQVGLAAAGAGLTLDQGWKTPPGPVDGLPGEILISGLVGMAPGALVFGAGDTMSRFGVRGGAPLQSIGIGLAALGAGIGAAGFINWMRGD